jgi:hypothetical protein
MSSAGTPLRRLNMEVDKRLTRAQAAAFVTDQTGVPLAARSLEKLPVPYCVLIGKAMYCRADLLRYVEQTVARASRRMGGRGRRNTSVETTT